MKVVRWGLTCLVFFALPILLILSGLSSRLDVQENEAIEKAFHQLEKTLLSLRRFEQTNDYLERLLNQLFVKILKSPQPLQTAKRGISNLKKRFPGLFFNAVTSEGEIIPEICEPHPPKAILKLVYLACWQFQSGEINRQLLDANWSKIKSFIGPDAYLDELIAKHKKFMVGNSRPQKRQFFHRVSAQGGLFVHANDSLDWANLAMKDILRRYHRRHPISAIQVGWETRASPPPPLPIIKAMDEFNKTGKSHFRESNCLLYLIRLESSQILWSIMPLASIFDHEYHRIAMAGAGTGLFVILAWLSFTIMVGTRKFYFSIRWRLIVLFSFGSSLPLFVLFTTGWDHLQQKYQADQRAAFDRQDQALRSIDAKFPLIRVVMQNKMNRVFKGQRWETSADQQKTQSAMKEISRRFFSGDYALFDRKGNIVFEVSKEVASMTDRGIQGRKLLSDICVNLLAELNNEPQSIKADLGTSLLESFGGIRNPLSIFSRGLGKIVEFVFSNNRSWTYMNPIRNAKNQATHIFLASWRRVYLERGYLESRFPAEERLWPGQKLFATDDNMDWCFPASFSLKEELRPLVQDLIQSQGTLNSKLFLGKKTLLITGTKPREFPSCYLFAIQNDDAIQAGIRVLENRLALVATASLIMSLFLGIMLSQKFLMPVNDLSLGVQAISEKNFQHLVPVRGLDELGNLAGLFNHMMESLQEVDTAREVQGALFPIEPLTVGEYTVYGVSRAATQLGGDYYDYFLISNRFLLVIIGDVTGHGVPAALVMAMSKALVLQCSRQGTSPENIMDTLNAIILQSTKRRLLMTLGLLWIDTVLHESTIMNGGHCFPFLQSTSNTFSMIESRGSPLGARQNAIFKGRPLSMHPGERLYYYTDGLIESIPLEDGRSHFDHFQEYLAARPKLPVKEACYDILDHHPHMATGTPQPDDFTVVIVERNPQSV